MAQIIHTISDGETG